MEKTLSEIETINDYMSGIDSYEQFIESSVLMDAVCLRFVQIIENIKNISNEFKNQHPEIPWGKMMGFRNGIVHDYGKVDYVIVYETFQNNLIQLKELFETNIR